MKYMNGDEKVILEKMPERVLTWVYWPCYTVIGKKEIFAKIKYRRDYYENKSYKIAATACMRYACFCVARFYIAHAGLCRGGNRNIK